MIADQLVMLGLEAKRVSQQLALLFDYSMRDFFDFNHSIRASELLNFFAFFFAGTSTYYQNDNIWSEDERVL